jgi:hypothetical protein
MSSADPLIDVERVTSEGLDHVFTHANNEAGGHGGTETNERSEEEHLVDEANGLSVAQTAVLLGFDQQSVVKLIKERKLCAKRAFGTRNWVIDLECVQAWLQKLGFGSKNTDSKGDLEPPENHRIVLPSDIDDDASNRTLWYKLDLSGQQLRAASYRIGYLESQVELYKNQAALLPDLQSEAARTRSAETAAEDLRMQLSLAQAELARFKRPWWKIW